MGSPSNGGKREDIPINLSPSTNLIKNKMEMKNDFLQVPLFSVCHCWRACGSCLGWKTQALLFRWLFVSSFVWWVENLFLVSVIQMKFLCKWVGLWWEIKIGKLILEITCCPPNQTLYGTVEFNPNWFARPWTKVRLPVSGMTESWSPLVSETCKLA